MEDKKLTLGSLFSGSGGFELAGILAGAVPVWNSEVEPFPVRVTEKRLPSVKHYGDVGRLSGAQLEPVDIITFGSPCQNLSIAGNREGLSGEKSSLFYEAIRIIMEMREATDGRYPRYCVWENVKGAFTSNKGEDFRTVLEAFCKVKDAEVSVSLPCDGKWEHAGSIVGEGFSLAWRLFDSQWWGVPQRRERIYLVCDLAGGSGPTLLFESEGRSRYSAAGFRAWQESAGRIAEGIGETGRICLNDQGGSVMEVSEDVTATLRAQTHGHPPVVLESAGFCTEHSAKARGIGYEKEKSPTLRAGVVPAAIALEHHPNDSRLKISEEDVSQALTGRMGTGGGNVPLVMENAKTFDVRLTSEGTKNWRANVYETDIARTIDTGGNAPDSNQGGVAVCEPKAFGLCSKTSHAMLSDNPDSGFYEATTSRCLDQGSGSPTRNQGGIVVVEGNGSRPSHKGDGYRESETMYTLNATEQHAVAFADVAASLSANDGPKGPSSQQLKNPEENFAGEPYHSSKNSYHTDFKDDPVADTLVATDYKDPPTVCEEPYYIVRRLTPIECARLQGFPDWWLDGLGDPDPSDETIARWTEVFEDYRRAITHAKKPKTENQIRKWLKEPYSDSAAYKLWGNGITLSVAYFVLSGIVWAAKLPEKPVQDCGNYPLD